VGLPRLLEVLAVIPLHALFGRVYSYGMTTTKRLRRLPAMDIRTTEADYTASILVDRRIAWDATQTPKIREDARLRSLRSDDLMAELNMRSVLSRMDEQAKVELTAAGVALALVAGRI
jgi:hypothetical protein